MFREKEVCTFHETGQPFLYKPEGSQEIMLAKAGEAESSLRDLCRASLSWAGHRNKRTFEVSLHRHYIGRTFPLWWNEGLSLLHACRESQNSKWGISGWEEQAQIVPPLFGGRDVLWVILWGSARDGIHAFGKRKGVPMPHQRDTAFIPRNVFKYSDSILRGFLQFLVEEGFSLHTHLVWDL